MLHVKNLSAYYDSKQILHDINFSLDRNELVVVLGKNGCGKSTLLRIVTGLQKPHSHEKKCPVFYDNKPIQEYSFRELAKIRAFVAQQEFCVWPYSVQHFVELGFFSHSTNENADALIDNALTRLNLQELKDQKISCISGGEFQRTVLARMLVQNSDFLILDEPFVALDIHFQYEIMNLLKELSETKGILVSCHDINLASRYADKIMILLNQSIFAFGSPRDVITSENIKKAYGMNASVRLEDEKPQIYITS
ncbi:MAG: ABC transporter ATP-binding protein [Treponemataceae bacterium]